MRLLLPALAVAALAGPAAACINDSELPGHEKEFRSQYGKPNPPPASAAAEPVPLVSAGTAVGFGTGVLLFTGAALVFRGMPGRG